ncbi:hypothetical protein [Azohydromonas lata]|uniref:Uncharacterized protein n=1 Tax=Azohydromonas lata TaxID=45677 RepID=A0ABU5IH88_9BURK|nr:hypothetical protein [Azohydromonas lata]MDZ5457881.1 hypothetical protein [Azohydromonas lata]
MKKVIALGALALALAGPTAAQSQAVSLSPAQEAVLRQFKSPAEKTAKDALWTSPSMFRVGVIDNGSSRDGYASYVCEVVTEQGLAGRGISVQVIDVQKLVRTNKWVALGEARCR